MSNDDPSVARSRAVATADHKPAPLTALNSQLQTAFSLLYKGRANTAELRVCSPTKLISGRAHIGEGAALEQLRDLEIRGYLNLTIFVELTQEGLASFEKHQTRAG